MAEEVPLKWHPIGTNTSPELVDYSAEVAEAMVRVGEAAVNALAAFR